MSTTVWLSPLPRPSPPETRRTRSKALRSLRLLYTNHDAECTSFPTDGHTTTSPPTDRCLGWCRVLSLLPLYRDIFTPNLILPLQTDRPPRAS